MLSNGQAVSGLARAPQCGVCGAMASTQPLVDVYGARVCQQCLRRMDADPRQKRHVMLAMSDAAYW